MTPLVKSPRVDVPFATLPAPRVLIVSLAGIGNLLMASPLFRALHGANPRVTIDVLVASRGTADMLSGHPRVRRVLRGAPKPMPSAWLRMAWALRRGRYDVGLVAHPGQRFMSASLLAFGGVQRRVGHPYAFGARETGVFLTDLVPLIPHQERPLDDRGAHDVVQNLNLLRPLVPHPGSDLGASLRSDPLAQTYDFPLAPADHAVADQWLRAHHLRPPLIGLHPGAHADLAYKRWPAERWSELGDRLAATYGATILVFGGLDEQRLQAEVAARMKKPAVTVRLPLRAAAALISRCALFVSNDSGLMHVAVSQGVPTIGLFGPTDERRTAPWGVQTVVIRAPGTVPNYDVAKLADFRRRKTPDPSLLALDVEHVLGTIRAAVPVAP